MLKIYDDNAAENICEKLDIEAASLDAHIEELQRYGKLPEIVASMQARKENAERVSATIRIVNNKMHIFDEADAGKLESATEKLKEFSQKLQAINSILESTMKLQERTGEGVERLILGVTEGIKVYEVRESIQFADAYLQKLRIAKGSEKYQKIMKVHNEKMRVLVANSQSEIQEINSKEVWEKIVLESITYIETPKELNGWLKIYHVSTIPQEGRSVEITEKIPAGRWLSRENRTEINPWAAKVIGESNIVDIEEHGELIDKDGRYWVAVGPNVMNTLHQKEDACTLEEMNYGTPIDVVLTDKEDQTYYIPCVVGECKQHTYPSGIYQTGYAFPDGCDPHPENNDYSVVEFCGKAPINGLGEYTVKEIIVYE